MSKFLIPFFVFTSLSFGAMKDIGHLEMPPIGQIATGANGVPSFSQVTLNAAEEKLGYLFYSNSSVAISSVQFFTETITTGDSIGVRLETVDYSAGSGNPTGTLFCANSSGTVTIAGTDDSKIVTATLASPCVVTISTMAAVVLEHTGNTFNGAFNAGSNDISQLSPYYTSSTTTAGWARTSQMPIVGLIYSDGTYKYNQGILISSGFNAIAYNNSSTPDERGNVFTMPATMRAVGVTIWQDTDQNYDIRIYDDGAIALSTISINAPLTIGTGAGIEKYPLTEPITLYAGKKYRLVSVPTTASNNSFYQVAYPIGANVTVPGGIMFYGTSAKDPTSAESWTDVNNAMYFIGLIFDQIEVNPGGGFGISQ